MKLTLAKINFTVASMKHYEQAPAIARALDIVGDRWSLLLVRELTLGPRRYRDLATGLPRIPTNVLAAPLLDLRSAVLSIRRTLPTPTGLGLRLAKGEPEIGRRALEPIAVAGARRAPSPPPQPPGR